MSGSLLLSLVAVFLPIVVIHLDAKHNGTRHGRDDIGDEQGPVLEHQALDGKEDAAQAHHQERGQGDAIGVVGADGVNRLGHVAQYQANRCGVTDDVGQIVGNEIHHNREVLKKWGRNSPTC